jgi:uncharacterized membrane protein YeiH
MIACCLLNVHIGGLLDVAPASEVSGAAYGLFSDLPYVAWAIAGVFAVIAVFAPVYASAISVAAFCVVGALNACFVDPMPYASIIAWVVQGFAFAGAMRDAKKKRRRGFFSWVYLVFAVAAAVSLLVVPLFWPSLPAIQYGPGLIIVCAVVMVLMFACAF